MPGACGCESGRGKVCEGLEELPSKGMREGLDGLKGLRAGKRQPWACGGVWKTLRV